MAGHARTFVVIVCCLVVVGSSAMAATGTGQARGVFSTVHRTTRPVRCAVRNTPRGTVRIATALSDTTTLNPYVAGTIPDGLFTPLFDVNNKLKTFPEGATVVPTLKNGGIRDGGRTVVVHLKHGQRWSNGTEVTSADAKFGWRVAADPVTGPICFYPCSEVAAVETPDRYTIVYRLKHVTPTLLSRLPDLWPSKWPGAWNGNPHAAAVKIAKDPTFTFKGPNYPTDGPYQVARVIEGKQVVLKPMKYYTTMTCGAYISTIDYIIPGSDASMISAAAEGRVDLWDAGGIGVSLLPEIERHEEYTVHVDPAFDFEHLEFNVDPTFNGKANPLHDARVRLALALAINKTKVTQAEEPLNAGQVLDTVAWTPWINTPKLVQEFADRAIRGQWDPLTRTYIRQTGRGRALVDARALLASTRWKHGFTLDVETTSTPQRRAAVETLTSEWAKIGVKVNFPGKDSTIGINQLFGAWNDGGILSHGLFQAALFTNLSLGTPDALAPLLESKYIDRRRTNHLTEVSNYSGIDDPAIDRAFTMSTHTADHNVRKKAFAAIQQEINRNAYWVPLFFRPFVWTSDGRIENVTFSAGYGSEGWNVWAWKVRGG